MSGSEPIPFIPTKSPVRHIYLLNFSWFQHSFVHPQLHGSFLSIGIDPREAGDGLNKKLELHVPNLESGVESIHLAYFPIGKGYSFFLVGEKNWASSTLFWSN